MTPGKGRAEDAPGDREPTRNDPDRVPALREEALTGGRVTAGVVRLGDTVRRPGGPRSDFVHELLRHLAAVGFNGAPRSLGTDERGRDVLSYLPGDVPDDLGFFSDEQLASAFELLRAFHDATSNSKLSLDAEVVCHGDVSPCNTVFRAGKPVALIDFDTAAPGRRIEDLAYGLFLWLDLGNEDIRLDEQRRRLRLATTAYGRSGDADLVTEIGRQVALTAARLRTQGRESAAWWDQMHHWLGVHRAELSCHSSTRPPLEIAVAKPEAYESILELHREAGWPGTHVDGEVWAAYEAGQLVGSAQFIELEPALVLVDAIVVRASARDQGTGAELMRTMLATRPADWWLECRLERVPFYQRLDFRLVDEAEVPAIVKARVGGNPSRPQHFLLRSTIARDDGSTPSSFA